MKRIIKCSSYNPLENVLKSLNMDVVTTYNAKVINLDNGSSYLVVDDPAEGVIGSFIDFQFDDFGSDAIIDSLNED